MKSALKRPVDHTPVQQQEVARASGVGGPGPGGGGAPPAGGRGHGAPSFGGAQATTPGVDDDLDLQLLLG